MTSTSNQPPESGHKDALETAADSYVNGKPDYKEGFLKASSYPECFSAIYVKQIGWDQGGSVGQVEFLATGRDGQKLTTTRVVPR